MVYLAEHQVHKEESLCLHLTVYPQLRDDGQLNPSKRLVAADQDVVFWKPWAECIAGGYTLTLFALILYANADLTSRAGGITLALLASPLDVVRTGLHSHFYRL